MTKHTSLPGFRDFYPIEMARRNQIFRAWREVAGRYGFEEYDGPPLEGLALFVEKSGAEIVNQLFNFVDKGEREVALRPEMTPTLVRMLGARLKGMPRPVRWFSTPQLFRYEKQQRGRLREHFQLNVDIVGEESIYADVDLLAVALDVMKSLGLTSSDVVARISDRRLLRALLGEFGVTDEQLPLAYNLIDKIERDPAEVALKRLGEMGISGDGATKILSITQLSREEMRSQYGGNAAVSDSLDQLDAYFAGLASLGFADWVQFDMKIVRGLAYYTGIVFELFDRKGELRAICGGGRYDNLFGALAGVESPSLGFGMGDVVLGELLKERSLAVDHAPSVDFYLIAVDDSVRGMMLRVASSLRNQGKSVIYPFKIVAVGKALKTAAASGASEAIVVGPDEIARGRVVARDLKSGTTRELQISSLIGIAP